MAGTVADSQAWASVRASEQRRSRDAGPKPPSFERVSIHVIQAPQSMSKTRRERGPSEGMPSCSATPIEAVAAQRARRFEADARTCKRRSPRTRMAASAVGRVQSPDRFAGLARLAGCCGAICNGRTRATQAIDFPSMAP